MTWRAVSPAHPCKICGRPNREHTSTWCSFTTDGLVAACGFVEKGCVRVLPGGRHLHRLTASSPWRPPVRVSRAVGPEPPAADLLGRIRALQRPIDSQTLSAYARELGVAVGALERLEALPIPGRRGTWGFLMRLAPGADPCGLRIRGPRGKWALRGSRSGLFIPRDLDPGQPWLAVEGPTDAAAGLSAGFETIGRASAREGCNLLQRICRTHRPPAVIVVADADDAGRRGAQALLAALAGRVRLGLLIPPAETKDLRAWVQQGATKQDIEERIEWIRVRIVLAS